MKKGAFYIVLVFFAAVILKCGTSGRFKPARVALDRDLDYPLSAQLEKIEGDVVTEVFVNSEGKPEEIKIVESSGHDVLDSAAYRFIHTLTFNPANLDEKSVSSWTRLILRYKLTDIAFEEKRWIDDVLGLQSQIKSAGTPHERLEFERRLYVRYIGLSNYVERYKQLSINDAIRRVISKETYQQWQLFWDFVPVPFVVFDDFLKRYPDSDITDRAKEDLIPLLMDSEAEIRVRSLKSSRMARSAPELIAAIEKRLDELSSRL
jgi:TonB family protein